MTINDKQSYKIISADASSVPASIAMSFTLGAVSSYTLPRAYKAKIKFDVKNQESEGKQDLFILKSASNAVIKEIDGRNSDNLTYKIENSKVTIQYDKISGLDGNFTREINASGGSVVTVKLINKNAFSMLNIKVDDNSSITIDRTGFGNVDILPEGKARYVTFTKEIATAFPQLSMEVLSDPELSQTLVAANAILAKDFKAISKLDAVKYYNHHKETMDKLFSDNGVESSINDKQSYKIINADASSVPAGIAMSFTLGAVPSYTLPRAYKAKIKFDVKNQESEGKQDLFILKSASNAVIKEIDGRNSDNLTYKIENSKVTIQYDKISGLDGNFTREINASGGSVVTVKLINKNAFSMLNIKVDDNSSITIDRTGFDNVDILPEGKARYVTFTKEIATAFPQLSMEVLSDPELSQTLVAANAILAKDFKAISKLDAVKYYNHHKETMDKLFSDNGVESSKLRKLVGVDPQEISEIESKVTDLLNATTFTLVYEFSNKKSVSSKAFVNTAKKQIAEQFKLLKAQTDELNSLLAIQTDELKLSGVEGEELELLGQKLEEIQESIAF